MDEAKSLRDRAKRRKLILQGALVLLTALAAWGAVSNAQYNLTRLNMTSGFSFLERGTGWNYSFSLVERSINDPYSYTLFIGLLNTLFVGFICIVTTTVIGFIVGTMRDARHPALNFTANVYVQIFRSIPLILQAVFLYALLIHLGGPRQAINLADVAFLSGRGLMLPGLNVSPSVAVAMLCLSLALAIGLILSKLSLWRGLAVWLVGSAVAVLVLTLLFRPEGEGLLSIPELKGLRFEGGVMGTTGFLTGTKTYESQSILRVYPREQGILYASGDDSVIKTYDSFIKAETAFVASPDVMARAADMLREDFPVLTEDMRAADLRGSLDIKRSESLIVLKTKSREAAFASAKLEAVTSAYMDLTAARKDALTETRTAELVRREADLLADLREIDRRTLEVGGEYGAGAIIKAHVEKIGQIDSLATRKAEVTRTLESMRSNSGAASADMNDEHILRATLLDRGLADLNIEIARHKAELATLRLRYTPRARIVRDKVNQIEILAAAQADRREQIQVLGQTGALTDQTEGGEEESLEAIESLLAKVSTELDETRAEARDLNERRVELSFLEEERTEARRMLDQTRAALDVIRVESRNASAGLVEIMSPAVKPEEPAEDSST